MDPKGLAAAGLVAAGGAAGALARHWITMLLTRPGVRFPYGTLVCNIAGCLAIGAIMWFVVRRPALPPAVRLGVVVGLLGSMTTFSTFGYDTVELAREGHAAQAVWNVALNLALGMGAVALGMWGASLVAPPQ
jgi:fluoride exporter